jgi:hypothetical protein
MRALALKNESRSIMRQIEVEPKESVSGQSHKFMVMHRPVHLEDL